MNDARRNRSAHSGLLLFTGLLLFVFCLGLLGSSGFVYAADRTVVGELYSADN